MVARAEGRGDGELFHGSRALVWEDEKVLKTDGGDGRPTVSVCLVPLSCTL